MGKHLNEYTLQCNIGYVVFLNSLLFLVSTMSICYLCNKEVVMCTFGKISLVNNKSNKHFLKVLCVVLRSFRFCTFFSLC